MGLPVKQLRRRHGFSEASSYAWRSKHGGLNISDAKRLKELTAENTTLQKLLAESLLENEMTRDALRGSGDHAGTPRAGAASGRAGAE